MEHSFYGNFFARYQRWIVALIGSILCAVLAFSAWVGTPSYTLYRIKRAVDAQDLATFRRYVDLDSVLDHALQEVGGEFFGQKKPESSKDRSAQHPPGKGLLKGLLRRFAPEVKELVQDGARQVVERMVTQPRNKPAITYPALAAAMWQVRREGKQASLVVKTKKGAMIEVRMRQVPEGYWRVVEVTNVKALLAEMKLRRLTRR
jgi:hypothetical protein